MLYLLQGFSTNMLKEASDIVFEPTSKTDVKEMLTSSRFVAAMPSPELSVAVSVDLGMEIGCSRQIIQLRPGDQAIIITYQGPVMREWMKEIPRGAQVVYWLAEVWEV